MERIIVIGGMGPQASLELHRRIIQRAQANGAKDGHEYPCIVHFSLPVEDFLSDDRKKQQAFAFIIENLRDFRFRENDTVVIACNTAHLLQTEIEAALGIRILSLVDLAVEYIAKHYKHIDLLASPTTVRTSLYEERLAQKGVVVALSTAIPPQKIESMIRRVIAGEPVSIPKLQNLTLLGCTEMSCLFADDPKEIDPLQIVVNALLPRQSGV